MNEQNIRKVIAYFACKYKYNWENIYNAIKTKEPIEKSKLYQFKLKTKNFITIIDEDYPENFKQIYMPPLILFYKGNEKLLLDNQEIISIWSKPNLSSMIKNDLNKENVYAFIFEGNDIDEINKIINQNYKVILVANNFIRSDLEKINFKENVIFISESSLICKKPNFDIEQNIERILLGVSKKSLMLEKSIHSLNFILPLFKFEKRKIYVLNKNEYSNDEISKYGIENYEMAS